MDMWIPKMVDVFWLIRVKWLFFFVSTVMMSKTSTWVQNFQHLDDWNGFVGLLTYTSCSYLLILHWKVSSLKSMMVVPRLRRPHGNVTNAMQLSHMQLWDVLCANPGRMESAPTLFTFFTFIIAAQCCISCFEISSRHFGSMYGWFRPDVHGFCFVCELWVVILLCLATLIESRI